jgi:hypothetical protein
MTGTDQTAQSGSLAVVIVNWNGYEESARCLASLENHLRPDHTVVIVDNGSTDGSGDRLASEFGWCEFVFNDENRGFGGGCNSGIDVALAAGANKIVLLNPDTEITDNTLRELVSVQQASGASVVGATVTHADGTRVNPTPARYPDIFFYSGYRSNLPVAAESTAKYADQRWFDTDRVEGAGVLLTEKLLRERKKTVGHYLDDSLFMYCEEIELAMWCQEQDENTVIATNAVVTHDSEASSSRPFQLYYLTRNRVLIAHRYLSRQQRIGFDSVYPTTRLVLAARWLKDGNREIAMAVLSGLVDGYRHVNGQTR